MIKAILSIKLTVDSFDMFLKRSVETSFVVSYHSFWFHVFILFIYKDYTTLTANYGQVAGAMMPMPSKSPSCYPC